MKTVVAEEDKIWRQHAAREMLAFVKKTYEFTSDDIRARVHERIGPPANSGSWGPIFNQAIVKPGYAIEAGTTRSTNKAAKSRLIRKYRSTLCHDESQVEAIGKSLNAIRNRFVGREINLDQALLKAYQLGLGV